MKEEIPDPNDEKAGLAGKLVLTLFPFLLVLIFLLVEMWIRGRS